MIYLFISMILIGINPKDNAAEAEAISYIENYKQLAIVEMHRTGVPASITMAQALHESNIGKSNLATRANNHFGIKCKRYWRGSTYYHKDDDLDDQGNLIKSCFRSYENAIDSYVDHSNFLKFSHNYSELFELSRTDYVGWAIGLKSAGYATDAQYAAKLIRNIEKFQLMELDQAPNPLRKVKNLN